MCKVNFCQTSVIFTGTILDLGSSVAFAESAELGYTLWAEVPS